MGALGVRRGKGCFKSRYVAVHTPRYQQQQQQQQEEEVVEMSRRGDIINWSFLCYRQDRETRRQRLVLVGIR